MKFYIFFILALTGVFLVSSISCHTVKDDESNIFRYNENNGIATLDPAFARDLEIMWATNQLFDGLVEINSSFEIIPGIARSWSISENLTEYTFLLKDSVYFHDSPVFPDGRGRKVVAADFVYSFQRIRDPKVASPGAWIFDHVDTTQKGIQAPNDSTLIIRLRHPFPPFLSILTMQYCSVVPHEAIEHYGADFRSHPVGTGPFQFAFWYENNALVFHRNPGFHQRDEEGKRLPYLDAVKIDFVKDVSVEYQGLLSGKYDFMSGIHPSYKDELLDENGNLHEIFRPKLQFVKTAFIKTDYIGFMTDPKMNDSFSSPAVKSRFRKAIEMAIHKEEMVKYLRNNTVIAANSGFVPPLLLGDSIATFSGYDPKKAEEELKKLGFDKEKNRAAITIATTPDYTDLIEYIQFNLGKVGVDVNVQVMQNSAFREAGIKGQLESFRRSWLADYPDAENFFIPFLKNNFCPAGPNYTHYQSDAFEALYKEAMRVTDMKEKARIYHEMNALIDRDAPVIPLYYDQVSHFLLPSVKNWEINPINLIDLKKVKKVV